MNVLMPVGCAQTRIANFNVPACVNNNCPTIVITPPVVGPCKTDNGVTFREVTLSGRSTGGIELAYWIYGFASSTLPTESGNIAPNQAGNFRITARFPANVDQTAVYYAQLNIIDAASPAECSRVETVEVVIPPCTATCPTNLADRMYLLTFGDCKTTADGEVRPIKFTPQFYGNGGLFETEIDWGDNTGTEFYGSTATVIEHFYTSSGRKTVSIKITYLDSGCSETIDIPVDVISCTPVEDEEDPVVPINDDGNLDPPENPNSSDPPNQPDQPGLGWKCWTLLILGLTVMIVGQIIFVASVCFSSFVAGLLGVASLPVLFTIVMPFTVVTLIGFIMMLVGAPLLILWLFSCAKLDCRVYEWVRRILLVIAIIEFILSLALAISGPICLLSGLLATLTSTMVYIIFEAVGDYFECNVRTTAQTLIRRNSK